MVLLAAVVLVFGFSFPKLWVAVAAPAAAPVVRERLTAAVRVVTGNAVSPYRCFRHLRNLRYDCFLFGSKMNSSIKPVFFKALGVRLLHLVGFPDMLFCLLTLATK